MTADDDVPAGWPRVVTAEELAAALRADGPSDRPTWAVLIASVIARTPEADDDDRVTALELLASRWCRSDRLEEYTAALAALPDALVLELVGGLSEGDLRDRVLRHVQPVPYPGVTDRPPDPPDLEAPTCEDPTTDPGPCSLERLHAATRAGVLTRHQGAQLERLHDAACRLSTRNLTILAPACGMTPDAAYQLISRARQRIAAAS